MKIYRNTEGQYHKLSGPAIEFTSGDKEYWINGVRHRLDGPAVEWSSRKEYWINGVRHRLDGPAVEYADLCIWYFHNKRHRLDGPAVEWDDGGKEWYINDIEYNTYLEYLVAVEEYKQNQLILC